MSSFDESFDPLSSTQLPIAPTLVEPLRPFANRSLGGDGGSLIPRRNPPSPHRRHRGGDSISNPPSPPPPAALVLEAPTRWATTTTSSAISLTSATRGDVVPNAVATSRPDVPQCISPPPPTVSPPPQASPNSMAPRPTPSSPLASDAPTNPYKTNNSKFRNPVHQTTTPPIPTPLSTSNGMPQRRVSPPHPKMTTTTATSSLSTAATPVAAVEDAVSSASKGHHHHYQRSNSPDVVVAVGNGGSGGRHPMLPTRSSNSKSPSTAPYSSDPTTTRQSCSPRTSYLRLAPTAAENSLGGDGRSSPYSAKPFPVPSLRSYTPNQTSSRPPPLQVGGGRRPQRSSPSAATRSSSSRAAAASATTLQGKPSPARLLSPYTLATARKTVADSSVGGTAVRGGVRCTPTRGTSPLSSISLQPAASPATGGAPMSSSSGNPVPRVRPSSAPTTPRGGSPKPTPQQHQQLLPPKPKPKPAVPTLASLNLTPVRSLSVNSLRHNSPDKTVDRSHSSNPHRVAGLTLTRTASPGEKPPGASRGFVSSGNVGSNEAKNAAEQRVAVRKQFMQLSKDELQRSLHRKASNGDSGVAHHGENNSSTQKAKMSEVPGLGHFDSQSKEGQILHLVKTFQRQSLIKWTKKVQEVEQRCKRTSFLEEVDSTYLENVLSRNVAFMRNLESIISDAAMNDQSVDCGVIRHAYNAFNDSTALNDKVNLLLRKGEEGQMAFKSGSSALHAKGARQQQPPSTDTLGLVGSSAFTLKSSSSMSPTSRPKPNPNLGDELAASIMLSPRERHIGGDTSPRSPLSKRHQISSQHSLSFQPLDLETSMFLAKSMQGGESLTASPSLAGSFRSGPASQRSRQIPSSQSRKSVVRDVWDREGSGALMGNSRIVTSNESAVYYAKRKLEGKGVNDDDDGMADRRKRAANLQKAASAAVFDAAAVHNTSYPPGEEGTDSGDDTSDVGLPPVVFGVGFRNNSFCPTGSLSPGTSSCEPPASTSQRGITSVMNPLNLEDELEDPHEINHAQGNVDDVHQHNNHRAPPPESMASKRTTRSSASPGFGDMSDASPPPQIGGGIRQGTTSSVIFPASSDTHRGNPRGVPTISFNTDGSMCMDVVVAAPSSPQGGSKHASSGPFEARGSDEKARAANSELAGISSRVANRAGGIIEQFLMKAEHKRQQNLFQPPVDTRDPGGANVNKLAATTGGLGSSGVNTLSGNFHSSPNRRQSVPNGGPGPSPTRRPSHVNNAVRGFSPTNSSPQGGSRRNSGAGGLRSPQVHSNRSAPPGINVPHYRRPLSRDPQVRMGMDNPMIPTESSMFPYSPFLSEASHQYGGAVATTSRAGSTERSIPEGATALKARSKAKSNGSAAFAKPHRADRDRSGSATKALLGLEEETWRESTGLQGSIRRSSVASLNRSTSPSTIPTQHHHHQQQQHHHVERGVTQQQHNQPTRSSPSSSRHSNNHSLGGGSSSVPAADTLTASMSMSQRRPPRAAMDAPAKVIRYIAPTSSQPGSPGAGPNLAPRKSVCDFFNDSTSSAASSPGQMGGLSPPPLGGNSSFLDDNHHTPLNSLNGPSSPTRGGKTLAAMNALASAMSANQFEPPSLQVGDSNAPDRRASRVSEAGVVRNSLTAAKARRIQLLETLELLTTKQKSGNTTTTTTTSDEDHAHLNFLGSSALGIDASTLDDHQMARRVFVELYGKLEGDRQFRTWEGDVAAELERKKRLKQI